MSGTCLNWKGLITCVFVAIFKHSFGECLFHLITDVRDAILCSDVGGGNGDGRICLRLEKRVSEGFQFVLLHFQCSCSVVHCPSSRPRHILLLAHFDRDFEDLSLVKKALSSRKILSPPSFGAVELCKGISF